MSYPEDSRYPRILYEPLDNKDLIDFPCAPTWLNHYHDLGLTPRFVEECPQPQPTPDVLSLIEDIKKLRAECGNLRKEIYRRNMPKETAETGKRFTPIKGD